jgi:hypothetical protein
MSVRPSKPILKIGLPLLPHLAPSLKKIDVSRGLEECRRVRAEQCPDRHYLTRRAELPPVLGPQLDVCLLLPYIFQAPSALQLEKHQDRTLRDIPIVRYLNQIVVWLSWKVTHVSEKRSVTRPR